MNGQKKVTTSEASDFRDYEKNHKRPICVSNNFVSALENFSNSTIRLRRVRVE